VEEHTAVVTTRDKSANISLLVVGAVITAFNTALCAVGTAPPGGIVMRGNGSTQSLQ
jgi:hypothetical protein